MALNDHLLEKSAPEKQFEIHLINLISSNLAKLAKKKLRDLLIE